MLCSGKIGETRACFVLLGACAHDRGPFAIAPVTDRTAPCRMSAFSARWAELYPLIIRIGTSRATNKE